MTKQTKAIYSPWEIMTSKAYYETLLTAIPKAKKRIVIAVMLLLAEKNVARLMHLLQEAAARGVAVTLLFDNGGTRSRFIYKLGDGASRSTVLKQTFRTIEALASAGAVVYPFSKVRLNPYRGRCHTKIVIIDDDVYSFGGINFFDADFHNIDYMLHAYNPDIADELALLVTHMGTEQPPFADQELPVEQGAILFDGGEPNHSIVYERACELTAHSKRVWYVSQMTPSGLLGELLGETESTCYFNRPEQMLRPHAWGQVFDQQRYRIENSYTRAAFLHSKYMLFELKSGKKAVLTGSNNFSYRGIGFGTQEIALHSTDTALYAALQDFLTQNVS